MEFETDDCGLGADFTRRRDAALAALLPPLAHRLNNGLAALAGLGELVCTRPEAPAVRTLASTADGQTREVVRLIRSVSSFAKSLDGPPEKVDAVHEIVQVGGLLEPVCQAVGVELELSTPEVMPTEVVPRALAQLLIVCGVEVATAAEPRAVRLASCRVGGSFTIDVSARPGPGFEPALWSPVGVSLSEVRAETDRGFALRLCVPALGAEPAESAVPNDGGEARRSVLVFERDPQLADLVEAVLSEGGFEVVTTTEVDLARRAAAERQFDLLLVDEGSETAHVAATAELVAELRSGGALPVGSFGEGVLTLTPPARPALAKPFRPAELLEYTARCLG